MVNLSKFMIPATFFGGSSPTFTSSESLMMMKKQLLQREKAWEGKKRVGRPKKEFQNTPLKILNIPDIPEYSGIFIPEIFRNITDQNIYPPPAMVQLNNTNNNNNNN